MKGEILTLILILILNFFILVSLLQTEAASSRKQRLLFGGVITAVIVWVLSILITDLYFKKTELSLWASRISFFSSAIISYIYFLFVRSFRNNEIKKTRLDLLFWSICFIVFASLSLTPLILKYVTVIGDESLKSTFGTLYLPFGLYTFTTFVYSIYAFYQIYSREKNLLKKAQILNILIGSSLSIIASIITNILFPILGVGEIRSLGPFTLVFFLWFTYYAILRYRFLSARLIVGKILYLLITSSIPYLAFQLVYVYDRIIWGGVYEAGSLISGIVISLLFVYFLSLFNKRIEEFISKWIINTKFDPVIIRDRLNTKLSSALDLNFIVNSTIDTIMSTLDPQNIALLIVNVSKNEVIYKKYIDLISEFSFDDIKLLADYWSSLVKPELIIKEEIMQKSMDYKNLGHRSILEKIIKFMNDYEIEVIIPMDSGYELTALSFLGRKKNEVAYTVDDVNFLLSVIATSSVAISRSTLYSKVQDNAKNLQKRINEATQELQSTNIQLEESLRRERDIMDILGHELRTPLSVARNAVLMMEMYMKNKDQIEVKSLDNLIDKAKENIRREATLLETVLSSTRIENNRLSINYVKVDCKDVVSDCLDGYRAEAAKKGIELIAHSPQENLYAWAGREQSQEVLDNLVSNAIKYTNSGSVTIRLEDDGDSVKFNITDTGIGIPENEISNLGKKFHRVNMYSPNDVGDNGRKVIRPGGTGIGLYVVFGMLNLMKGTIDIQSKVGEGSTFSFTLPKYARQDVAPSPQPQKDVEQNKQITSTYKYENPDDSVGKQIEEEVDSGKLQTKSSLFTSLNKPTTTSEITAEDRGSIMSEAGSE